MYKFIFKSLSVLTTLVVAGIFSGGIASAARPGQTNTAATSPTTLQGNDISWPQCNKAFPAGQAFGIVGVNNGLANNTNPCFTAQYAWSMQSKGGTGQPLSALYVNTANPGLSGSWWPSSNAYAGSIIANPYGTCDGKDTPECAYIYGYAKAYDDANIRGVPSPASQLWWLDVETMNSWETNTTANTAVLEGMTAYFQSIGARVGLYSTSYQWTKIVGWISPASNLNKLQSWIAGASSASNAKQFCTSKTPLTVGSKVTMTQYISKNLDYDYSCI